MTCTDPNNIYQPVLQMSKLANSYLIFCSEFKFKNILLYANGRVWFLKKQGEIPPILLLLRVLVMCVCLKSQRIVCMW